MDYQRTPVVYEGQDPNQKGVTYVAIQTETQPPYVWATYFTRHQEDLPKLGKDMLVLPVKHAQELFDFKKGNLADLVR